MAPVSSMSTPSAYAGIGVYKITDQVGMLFAPSTEKTIAIQDVKPQPDMSMSLMQEKETTTEKLSPLSGLGLGLDTGSLGRLDVRDESKVAQSPLSIQVPAQSQRQQQVLQSQEQSITPTFGGFTSPSPPKPPRPEKPKPPRPIPPISFIVFPGEKVYKKGTSTGYHTEVKDKRKWRRVTDQPYTRRGAKDVGARIVDNTTSARFRIEPVKKTKIVKGKKKAQLKVFPKGQLKKGDDYFNQTSNKFRGFNIFKGRKTQLKDEWIEKKNKRIDTPGEASRMTVAQFTSRQQKRAAGLPVRRSKGGRKRFRL